MSSGNWRRKVGVVPLEAASCISRKHVAACPLHRFLPSSYASLTSFVDVGSTLRTAYQGGLPIIGLPSGAGSDWNPRKAASTIVFAPRRSRPRSASMLLDIAQRLCSIVLQRSQGKHGERPFRLKETATA